MSLSDDLPEAAFRKAKRLEGKVAVVTGAGSVGKGYGTGRAMSILFALEGARVGLMDNAAEHVKETQEIISRNGGDSFVIQGDITKSGDCQAAIKSVTDRYGRLDILVNNVGAAVKGTVVDVTEQDWDRIFDINIKATYLMSKYAVPQMERSGGGSIVNISSVAVRRPGDTAAYTASKGAVECLTYALAKDHGPQGIRANCISPGPIFTPRLSINRATTEAQRQQRTRLTLLEQEGTAWDIAWAAVYLASDEARYVTGVVHPVDGGSSIKSLPYH